MRQTLRVALDATPLSLTSGGLARYTRELSAALVEEFPEDSCSLLPAAGGRRLRLWWPVRLPLKLRQLRIDVFHGTNFEVPYLPLTPSVLTLHDLSPWMEPAWHGNAGRVRLRTPFLVGLGIATLILTDSDAVRRQAIDRFGLSPARVAAVPLAAPRSFQPASPAPTEKPYFLSVGTLEPRKNIRLLIDAWRPLRETHNLVLVGRRRQDFPELPPEPGLRLAGEVPDADLPALYSGAVAFVYPSLYEGFGLPVLEAMQCGACVIASTDPAIAETAGDAALRLDPRDTRAWSEALLACSRGGEWLERRREGSLRRATLFSWARTARLTREVYAEAVARFGR